MATAVIHKSLTPAGTTNGDPCHDPIVLGVGVAFAVLGLAILVLTGLLIWGVEYRVPGWNSNSYPPPIAHRW
ncbi:MAG: hypothetical protein HY824_13455 [Acidobacteria bacterium]|nr:hypothetical protein [Acidobacteriota bacterium]